MTPAVRKLATIVALDVAGYSARTETDEAKTTAEVAALRGAIEAIAKAHGGRIFNTAGDGFMLEFSSSLAAVEAAADLASKCEPKVRVGVHLGDVVVQPNGDLLGHGVNVAARLMARADPGSALVSAMVRQTIRGPLAERLVSRGALKLDKMSETIEAFALGEVGSSRPTPVEGVLAPPPGDLSTRSDTISIAVIPFEAHSNDPADTSLARGLSIEVANALGQVGRLRAVSSIAVGGKAVDLRTLARDWRAQYAVTGSLVRHKAQYRILAQLVSVEDGAQIWSSSYDESDADLIEIRRLVAEGIVRQIGGEIMHSEYARIGRAGASNANAWALTAHSAHMIIEHRGGPHAWDEAIALVEKAIAMAPDYGAAQARLSALCGERIIMLASPDPNLDRQRALAGAKKAIELSGSDPYALMSAAQGMTICGDVERARKMLIRALKAVPHDLLAWVFYWANCAGGLPEDKLPELIDSITKTIAAHPTHPLAAVMTGIAGICHFRLGDLAQAKPLIQDCVDDAPGFPSVSLYLAAIHILESNVAEAKSLLSSVAGRGFRTDRRYIEAMARAAPSSAAVAAIVAPFCDG